MGKYTVSDEELQDCLKQIKAILHIDDDEPGFLVELKEASQDVLNDNPDITFDEWKCALMEQYPTEIVDALGTNQEEVKSRLCEIWKETKRK